jgi:SAM-dependent methyltransferase
MNDFEKLYSEDGVYGDLEYGSPWVNRGIRCAHHVSDFILKRGGQRVLCFGSGNGYELVKFLLDGYDAYSVDLYVSPNNFLNGRQIQAYGQQLPFKDKSFDLFFSCECMEHVKDEWVDDILNEAKRVSDEVFFTIADRPDPFDTHICLHPIEWWVEKFEGLGFGIINAQTKPHLSIINGRTVGWFGWPDGTLIRANC